MKRVFLFVNFNKSERRGILVLMVILAGVLALRFLIPALQKSETKKLINFQISEYVSSPLETEGSVKETKVEKLADTLKPVFFKFNPNNSTYNDLRSLGFSHYNANTIINYRANGGKFYNESDLLRVYGIDSSLVRLLAGFILYNEPDRKVLVKEQKHKVVENSYSSVKKVAINSQNIETLKQVKGVGDVFATRIIKYGKLLGGYTSIEQLKEVYGISEEIYGNIQSGFILDSADVATINLNKATFKELIKHPYVQVQHVKAILKYRDLMGEFSDLGQLKTSYIFTAEEFRKVAPYLRAN